jgi:hypothetical protein
MSATARLPDYFPTVHKSCKEPADVFFACFNEHAIMMSPTDNVTAKESLTKCQKELGGYTQCMEKHHKRDGKVWWRVW